ncbi:MAG: site-2 protease family protein [Ignavibacteriales bacterium]|nr:site-2 protease family protein [Ignavibacteriales bacterium]
MVFIHEFGHFAAAKLSGMRADVFAIGFGKDYSDIIKNPDFLLVNFQKILMAKDIQITD